MSTPTTRGAGTWVFVASVMGAAQGCGAPASTAALDPRWAPPPPVATAAPPPPVMVVVPSDPRPVTAPTASTEPPLPSPPSPPPASGGGEDDRDGPQDRRVEQRLTYMTQPRDTLGSIAQCFKVRAADIRRLNGLRAGRPLPVGRTLVLPEGADATCVVKPPPPLCFVPLSQDAIDAVAPRCVHRVRPRETVSSLARAFGVGVSNLHELNQLSCDDIEVGELILVCDDARERPHPPEIPPIDIPPDPPPPPLPACETSFVGGGNKKRVAFLVGGLAPDRFDAYLDLAKQNNVEPDLESLEVVLVNKSGETLRLHGKPLSIGAMFAGLTPKLEWEHLLKGVDAAPWSQAVAAARPAGADVVCGQ
jgi:LysM repeat protein